MIPTDGMAIPRIKQCFAFFIRGIAMPSVGIFRLHGRSIAICGTRKGLCIYCFRDGSRPDDFRLGNEICTATHRIQPPRRCPKHGEISSEQIVKAFEFGPAEDVVLSEDELDQIKPVDDETIHFEHLLPAGRVAASRLSGPTLNLIPAHPAATEGSPLVVKESPTNSTPHRTTTPRSGRAA